MRALVIPIAYLLGSIPFGYLIVRATQGADVRETGSGGTGATNVSRRAGKAAGVMTLVLDALKGAAAVAIAKVILGLPIFAEGGHTGSPLQSLSSNSLGFLQALTGSTTESGQNGYWWVAAAAIAVILGHMFPVWLRFRGGKGVATGVGVFLILAPMAVAFAGVIFLVIVLLTRYVSLGAIVAAVTIPLVILIQNYITLRMEFGPLITAASAVAVLIVFAHRGNIARLIQGTESKFT
ncbi:MAG: glycerol-3-phosphate 1-O-acyltransferase PlsY [bacterium]